MHSVVEIHNIKFKGKYCIAKIFTANSKILQYIRHYYEIKVPYNLDAITHLIQYQTPDSFRIRHRI